MAIYKLDPSHSNIGFTVRHMGFTKVRGSFEQVEGTINMQGEDLGSIQAEAVVQTDSITTRDANRDTHLRSADFFDVENHPTITFRSTGVKNVSGNQFVLVGDFTIRGVTKTIELDAEYEGKGIDPWGGTRVGFSGRTSINRKDYGLNWNAVLEAGGLLVSENVDIEIEFQAVQQAEG